MRKPHIECAYMTDDDKCSNDAIIKRSPRRSIELATRARNELHILNSSFVTL